MEKDEKDTGLGMRMIHIVKLFSAYLILISIKFTSERMSIIQIDFDVCQCIYWWMYVEFVINNLFSIRLPWKR